MPLLGGRARGARDTRSTKLDPCLLHLLLLRSLHSALLSQLLSRAHWSTHSARFPKSQGARPSPQFCSPVITIKVLELILRLQALKSWQKKMLLSMQIRHWQQDSHRAVDVSSSVQRDTLMDQHDPFFSFSVEDTASACEARISTPQEERDGTEDTISNWVSPSDPNRNISLWMDLR